LKGYYKGVEHLGQKRQPVWYKVR